MHFRQSHILLQFGLEYKSGPRLDLAICISFGVWTRAMKHIVCLRRTLLDLMSNFRYCKVRHKQTMCFIA